MISATPLADRSRTDLARRDLIAIFEYLNRKELEGKSARQQCELVDGILRKLAHASRMQ